MKNLLRLDTSLFADKGASSELMNDLIEKLSGKTSYQITTRKFSEEEIPHLDGSRLAALMTAEEDRSEVQQQAVEYSDNLIHELKQADVIVIGLPMYNFGVPSMLKAWFDHVARAGVTFQYTSSGSEGLLKNKKVYLVTTRGGIHKDQATDLQVPFVKTFLNFLGLDDVEVIYAEGLNMGGDSRDNGFATARASIAKLALA